MKTVDAKKLKPGTRVTHKDFGVCTVKEAPFDELLGILMTPDTKRGKYLLAHFGKWRIVQEYDFWEKSVRKYKLVTAPTVGVQPTTKSLTVCPRCQSKEIQQQLIAAALGLEKVQRILRCANCTLVFDYPE